MARSFAHVTPRYVWDRLILEWYETRNPNLPWLTSDANLLIDKLLRNTDVGIEFGSGRSTIWFAKKIQHLISVEHNDSWYQRVAARLREERLDKKVDYRLERDGTSYAAQAATIAPNSIDFALVDGIERDLCAVNIVPKIRSGGLLVIDNVNWYLPNDWTSSPNSRRQIDGPSTDLWGNFVQLTTNWRRVWTSSGVTDTCIYFKE